jgi:hypothetical protein
MNHNGVRIALVIPLALVALFDITYSVAVLTGLLTVSTDWLI